MFFDNSKFFSLFTPILSFYLACKGHCYCLESAEIKSKKAASILYSFIAVSEDKMLTFLFTRWIRESAVCFTFPGQKYQCEAASNLLSMRIFSSDTSPQVHGNIFVKSSNFFNGHVTITNTVCEPLHSFRL